MFEAPEYTPIINVDELCLRAISITYRCDDEAFHGGPCTHKHTNQSLCRYERSFPELENKDDLNSDGTISAMGQERIKEWLSKPFMADLEVGTGCTTNHGDFGHGTGAFCN